MTSRHPCPGARRRGAVRSLLVVLPIVLLGCDPLDREPVADALPEYDLPERVTDDGHEVVLNAGPRERLRVRDHLPDGRARLLFMDGRATTTVEGNEALWADLEGGRVIHFDASGAVKRIYQGSGEAAPPEPVVAWPSGEGVQAFERDGTRLTFSTEAEMSRADGGLPAPVTGAASGRLAVSRSPLFVPLAPVLSDAPLLWIASDPSGPARPLGKVRRPEEPHLGYLTNTGWAVPASDGGAYFASALRPELVRLDPDGTVRWRSEWTPDRPVLEPAVEAVDGTARARFEIIQHAVARGPDGRIYVLAASDPSSGGDHLLAFEEDGTLARMGTVPEGEAVFVDRRGAVYAVPENRALMDPEERDRPTFEPFELPGLEGERWVELDEYRGRAVVLNVWASWCPPCRAEIPALDQLAEELDPDDAVVIGLNDDRVAQRGAEFLVELGGVSYPNAAGEGALRSSYGYRGLPYTVVLDRDHRVVRSFYGFGGSLDPIREALGQALGNPAEGGEGSD